MDGAKPDVLPGAAVELDPNHLVDVEEERRSLLYAAAGAENIAMLTGTHGVASPPLDRARARAPLAGEIDPGSLPDPDDAELGVLRAFVRARSGDPVGEARARLELARAELHRGHRDAAREAASAALEVAGQTPAAHAMVRALLLGRQHLDEQLAHVTALAEHASDDGVRADWTCERARLLEAKGGVTAESVQLWKDALALCPDHTGALYGAEVALEAAGRFGELAELFARLADLAGEPETAGWLHVERAMLHDRRLGDPAAARDALDRALSLAPGLGPVRAACVDFAVAHRDEARLSELLESEAAVEPDPARAARLELDAALAALRGGGDRARAVALLERAHRRAPASPLVDLRAAGELARLYAAEGRDGDVLRVRKASFEQLTDAREQLVALRAIATAAERAGEIDDAVLALERARVLDGDDPISLAELDRLLARAARHDARAVLWMREAARLEAPADKARALLASAEAARAAGREGEARKQRQAAWLTAPSEPFVFDALAEGLAPSAQADAVEERIAHYRQAVRATADADRKLYFLEKMAWLYDDVAGDARAATRVYEDILAVEPARLSALIGLASAAARAGDGEALARALSAHAGVTADVGARAELRLRAAEALASCDEERSLALATELSEEPAVRERAAALVTRLHEAAERWERAAESFETRAAAAADLSSKIALSLSQVDILQNRLGAPLRALEALSRIPPEASRDPAVIIAKLEALERLGDEERLRTELEAVARDAPSATLRAALFVRIAELDERSGRDAQAVEAYRLAREALPEEPLVVERLRRLGARVELSAAAEVVPPLLAATRGLETDAPGSVDPLLAAGARDVAALRTAERLARRSGTAPQLANALALGAEAHASKVMARRALEGLAQLVAWTLPPSDDREPWERLLALGTRDVATIDALVARAAERAAEGDAAALAASICAASRRVELAADDTERLLLCLDLVRLHRRAGQTADAATHARRALAADGASLTAATSLAALAAELEDTEAAIAASRALAEIVVDPQARAELLRDAADLSLARGDQGAAAELLERALRAHPDDVQVAARLATLQRARGALSELARALTGALEAAASAAAIVPMASELADVAKVHLGDPLLAIFALERVRAVDPSHVPTLFLLAELFISQRAWDKALVALAQTFEEASAPGDKLVALVGRASIYRRALQQPGLAEAELRAALEIDPHYTRAVRALLDLGVPLSAEERAALLGRLAVGEIAPAERLRALVELSDARRALGDAEGAEGALVEAASLSPDPGMLERVRATVGADPQTLTRVLSRALARAREGGHAVHPAWLVALGRSELELRRFDEAIERLGEALHVDPSHRDARVLLSRALAARGRHAPAVEVLAPLFSGPPSDARIDAEVVRLLEASLASAGHGGERWVARELRAIAGDLAPGEQAELTARIGVPGYAEGLTTAALRQALMPGGLGRHPLWDVAAIAGGLAGKLARVELAEVGASTRERVKARAAHPARAIFDRVARAFELVEVELAVSEHVNAPVVACEDVPWVVAPASLAAHTEPQAIAALAGPMARIALGVPWLGAASAHDVLALLVALARQVAPAFSSALPDPVEPLVGEYAARARRALDRKRRRALEELAPTLDGAPPLDAATFASAVALTEARAAFVLSGSLRASLDVLARADAPLAEALSAPGAPALAFVLGRGPARDLASFALGSEATALRRRIGSLTF